MKEQILKLRGEGKTYNQITKDLGCSKSLVSYYCGDNQKEKANNRRKNKRRKNRIWLRDYKKSLCCSDCGDDRWWVLDFHHTDPKKKEGGISIMIKEKSKEKVIKEINKCVVLCSNCHRDLHYQENNSLSQL